MKFKSLSPKEKGKIDEITPAERPFGKNNLIMMGVSLALIILGFILMSGGASQGTEFNPEVFSTRRIVVGPLFCFLGFLSMAFAIVWKPKKN